MLVISVICGIGLNLCLFILVIGRKNKPQINKVKPKKPWWKLKVNEFDTGTSQSAWRVALFVMRHTMKHYLSFYRFSFHPWDHDNRKKLKEVTQEFRAHFEPQPQASESTATKKLVAS